MIDLTVATSTPSSSLPSPGHRSPPLIDLTVPDPVSSSPRDHMHAVVALLQPGAVDLTRDASDSRRKAGSAGTTNPSLRKNRSPLAHINIEVEETYNPLEAGSLQKSHQRTKGRSVSTSPLAWSPVRHPEGLVGSVGSAVSVVEQECGQKSGGKAFKPFPFVRFPPEIRNYVYKMLLTTPKVPIEFPEPTGRNRALRAAGWEKCTTWKIRRMHKTIFLEILEVSRQLHAEASGILYGCNVFKYRSDYGTCTQ